LLTKKTCLSKSYHRFQNSWVSALAPGARKEGPSTQSISGCKFEDLRLGRCYDKKFRQMTLVPSCVHKCHQCLSMTLALSCALRISPIAKTNANLVANANSIPNANA
jgi:hypothetical protein